MVGSLLSEVRCRDATAGPSKGGRNNKPLVGWLFGLQNAVPAWRMFLAHSIGVHNTNATVASNMNCLDNDSVPIIDRLHKTGFVHVTVA